MKKRIPEVIGKRYFVVYDPIFAQRIHILFNCEATQYTKLLNRLKVKDVADKEFNDFSGISTQLTFEDKPTEYVIWMRDFQWAIKHQGTLIHEITHTVIKLWGNNNIPFNYDTQEFAAHAISRLYEDIAHKLLKKL